MIKKSKRKEIKFGDLILDSNEELQFCYYLEELRKAKYIEEWNRAKSLSMTGGFSIEYTHVEELKTKTKISQKKQVLLRDSEYTADFIVKWNKKAFGIFVTNVSEAIAGRYPVTTPFICDITWSSYVEVKPSSTFDPNNMLRLFRLNQKFVWKLYHIFVNLAIPTDLFQSTFTPELVKIPMDRKLKEEKWKRKSLKQYVNG